MSLVNFVYNYIYNIIKIFIIYFICIIYILSTYSLYYNCNYNYKKTIVSQSYIFFYVNRVLQSLLLAILLTFMFFSVQMLFVQ